MSAVVLALLERPGAAAKLLLAARQAARLMGAARINVLAVRAPTSGAASGAGLAAELARLAALHGAYQAWAGSPDAGAIATEWIELEGAVEPLVEDWGGRADLIVLQRPGGKDFDRDRRAVQAALFDTGRPVLVVPETAAATQFGQRIAVAWRDDMRTTRAVVAALQWLSSTAEIHVMAGARKWETPPGLPAVFTEHGIAARLHVLPMQGQRNFGEALLARAHALSADLVLLGAFAHPMLFGPVLGGVTRHMLTSADLPVLMRY
jgi:nucleotide-binding universal stress UspA family protein